MDNRNRFVNAMLLLEAAKNGDKKIVSQHIAELNKQPLIDQADRKLLVSAYFVAKGTHHTHIMELISTVQGVRNEILGEEKRISAARKVEPDFFYSRVPTMRSRM